MLMQAHKAYDAVEFGCVISIRSPEFGEIGRVRGPGVSDAQEPDLTATASHDGLYDVQANTDDGEAFLQFCG
jgi:hypothetical protein